MQPANCDIHIYKSFNVIQQQSFSIHTLREENMCEMSMMCMFAVSLSWVTVDNSVALYNHSTQWPSHAKLHAPVGQNIVWYRVEIKGCKRNKKLCNSIRVMRKGDGAYISQGSLRQCIETSLDYVVVLSKRISWTFIIIMIIALSSSSYSSVYNSSEILQKELQKEDNSLPLSHVFWSI